MHASGQNEQKIMRNIWNKPIKHCFTQTLIDSPSSAQADFEQFGGGEANQTGKVAASRESDEAPILTIAAGDDLACNRDTSKGTILFQLVLQFPSHKDFRAMKSTYPKLTMVYAVA